MANVLFTRDSLTNIENPSLHPVTDGQLLFDTSGSGKMYMDVGTQRLEMGGAMTIDAKLNSTSTNPIQNKAVGGVMLSTLDEINAATSKGFITDALATRALAQKIGTTDISSIGDGTCTGAISTLNANIQPLMSEDRINIKVNTETNSLNAAERTGIYYVTGDNIQALPSGFSTYGLLFVMRSPYSLHPTNKDSVYSQLYVDVYNNRATRAFNNGAWTNWKNF
jgi:predicted RNA-binding protein associated with RNAse of E/G family